MDASFEGIESRSVDDVAVAEVGFCLFLWAECGGGDGVASEDGMWCDTEGASTMVNVGEEDAVAVACVDDIRVFSVYLFDGFKDGVSFVVL